MYVRLSAGMQSGQPGRMQVYLCIRLRQPSADQRTEDRLCSKCFQKLYQSPSGVCHIVATHQVPKPVSVRSSFILPLTIFILTHQIKVYTNSTEPTKPKRWKGIYLSFPRIYDGGSTQVYRQCERWVAHRLDHVSRCQYAPLPQTVTRDTDGEVVSAMWFGYCQGVFAGVLVSEDFSNLFPQTSDANVSGIVTSCFLVSTLATTL